ncbi:MAG: alginate lyase family protein [Candidatus Paceibacterota bacterium]|jgi:hypothetical protein
MNKLETIQNICREIRETPKKSLIYRFYYQMAKISGLFYIKFKIRNTLNVRLKDTLNIQTESLLHYFRGRNNSNFFIDPNRKDILRKLWLDNFSGEKEDLIRLADNICMHKISSFDLKDFNWGDPINWHLAPKTARDWPKKHWSGINISEDGLGDIKYTWHLNRHRHFYALGRAYWITNDEKYAKEFILQFSDWIKNNPPGIGVNWTSSLEVSIRLVSWIWSYYFFLNSPGFSEDILRSLVKNIHSAADHIESNLNFSRYCIPNDHFMGEAFALFLAGTVFPEFKRSGRWQKIGLKILNEEIDKQAYADGVYFMHSPFYQRFVMEFYVLFFELADLNKIELPAKVKEKFGKMLVFLASLADKNGAVPDFGENDGSKLYDLSNAEFGDFSPLIESSAMACYGKPAQDQALSEDAFWIFGDEYLEKKQKGDSCSVERTDRFDEGGYFILNGGNSRLFFRCGATNSYSHADMLSFVLDMGQKKIFMDNGTYLYNGGKKWRDYFKGTGAHNTVMIDGLDQMINRRKFKWLSPNPGKLIKFAKSDNEYYIEGEHYGYERLNDPVIHNRSIRYRQDRIVITDKFRGSGRHKIGFYFHLADSGFETDPKTKKLTLKTDRGRIEIQPQDPELIEIEIKTGDEAAPAGWHSPSYGLKVPCTTLKYSVETEMPFKSIFNVSIIQK